MHADYPLPEIINLLGDFQQQEKYLLNTLNNTACEYPKNLCIHQLFEQQVSKAPDNTAVVFKEQSLSYTELNSKANQLAHYLIAQGLKPDDFVGLCVERSSEMIIGLLAILKAGAAYLPLDPSYPKQRLEYMLSDSQITCLLAQSHIRHITEDHSIIPICLDSKSMQTELEKYPADNPLPVNLTSGHLSYVIYTSGSTGEPKGVMLEHSGVVNLFYAQHKHFSVTPDSKVLQFASINFDAATSW